MKKLTISALIIMVLLSVTAMANPVLNPIPQQTVAENSALTLDLSGYATAADNGVRVFYTNATFGTLNTATGVFTWTPGYDTVTTAQGSKLFTILVGVRDSDSTDNRTVEINVTNVNRAPVVTAALTPTTAYPNSTFSCAGTATDPDGDSIISRYHQFLVNGIVQKDWSATSTYTCNNAACVAGAPVVCKFKASDGKVNSTEATSNTVTLTTSTAKLTVSDVFVGGDNQEKSNPDEDEIVRASKAFTVSNTGSETVTSITITSTANEKYNVTFEPSTIVSLAPGASQSITMTIEINEETDAFFPSRDDPQDDRKLDIGDVVATGTAGSQSVTGTGNLQVQTENKLEIDRVRVYKNDASSKSLDDGETYESVKPGDKIKIEVTASNKFSSSSNVRIKDVEFTAESDDSDFNVDESTTIGTVNEASKKTDSIEFTVDDDADGTYEVKITLQGDDDYGATHGEQRTIRIKVEKEDQEILIKSAEPSKSELSCDRTFTMSMRVENTGNDDSDEVVFTVKSSALGIDYRKIGLDLQSGDDYTASLPFTVASTVKAGTYYIDVDTFFDYTAFEDGDRTDTKQITILVKACEPETTSGSTSSGTSTSGSSSTGTTTQKPTEEVEVVQEPVVQPTTGTTTSGVVATTRVSSVRDTETYNILLIAGVVIVAALVLFMFARLLAPRK